MSITYEKTQSMLDYLKCVEISIKSDFLHADKSEGFIFRPVNDKDRPYLHVVKQDGVVAGLSVVRAPSKDESKMFKKIELEEEALIIDKLVIKSWHRNIGLGTGLVEYICTTYPDQPLYAIVRQSPDNNIFANKIFKKLGFEICSTVDYFNKDFNDQATWALYKKQ